MNSPIKLPELPTLVSTVINDACWKFIEAMPYELPGPIFNNFKPAFYAAICPVLNAYAEQAVREALAAQVAKINAAMAAMSLDGVNGGSVQKEYFKAGARRAIQAVNSALIPENTHE
ncbi:hypothetical protein ACOTET_26690 [Achromobacter xylosoxidans]